MTQQEAIEFIKEGHGHSAQQTLRSRKMAVKALEKQIPKKPYFREEEGAKGYACPSCNMGVVIHLYKGGYLKEKFCSSCGQALDWSENSVGGNEK